jgi:hypothetical protein
LLGFAIGTVWRPSDKCVHLAGEGFARFGSRTTTSGEQKMRTAGGAVGALWGNGDADRWFGAGAMFDLGWARAGHVIVPVTFEGVGIKGPMLGFGIGAMWGDHY